MQCKFTKKNQLVIIYKHMVAILFAFFNALFPIIPSNNQFDLLMKRRSKRLFLLTIVAQKHGTLHI